MLIIILLIADATFQDLKDHKSGPYHISWPDSWINSQIEADSNYISSVSSFKFYFKVQEFEGNLSSSLALISFPTDQEKTNCTINSLGISDQDWTATCSYSFDPSILIYGPLEVSIFESYTGKLIARNSATGFLAFDYGSEPSPGDLFVSYEDNKSEVVLSQTSLVFSFLVPSGKRLFPGDYFELIPDSEFGLGNLNLAWVKESGKLFVGTDVVVDRDELEQFRVFVVGLDNEIPEMFNVSFRLSGWVNPNTSRKGGRYNWILKVWRFGVPSIIHSFKGTGPSKSVDPGDVYIKSFQPNRSDALEENDYTKDLTAYWTLIFTAEHNIPALGRIEIGFAGASIDDYSIKSNERQTKSTKKSPLNYDPLFSYNETGFSLKTYFLSSTRVRIDLGQDQKVMRGHKLFINIYLTMNDIYQVTIGSIITKDYNDAVIDELKNEKIVKLNSENVHIMEKAEVFIANSKDNMTEINKINQVGAFGIVTWFETGLNMTNETTVELFLPIQIAIVPHEDFFTFTKRLYALVSYSAKGEKLDSDTFESASETLIEATSGHITINLTETQSNSTIFIFIGCGPQLDQTTYTQLIPTKTASEIILKFQNDSETFIYTSTFYFSNYSIDTSFMMLCSNVYQPGSPGKVTYYTPETPIAENYFFKIYFEFQVNESSVVKTFEVFTHSNLNDDDLYPCSNSSLGLKAISSNKLYYIQETNLTSLSNVIVVPLPQTIEGNKYRVLVSMYAVSEFYSNEYLLYSGCSNYFTTEAEDTTSGSPKSHDPLEKVILSSTTIMITLRNEPVDTDLNGEVELEPSWYSFMLITPGSWRTSDPILTPGTSLISDSYLFPYSVYYINSVNIIYETVYYMTYYVRFTTGWMAKSNLDYTFVIGYTVSKFDFSGIKCVSIKGSVKVKAEALLVYNYGPNVVSSYTYNSRTTDISLSFLSSITPIYKGSIIEIYLDYWYGCVTEDWKVVFGSNEISGTFDNHVWISDPLALDVPMNQEVNIFVSNVFLPKAEEVSVMGFKSIKVEFNETVYLTWEEEEDITYTEIIELVAAVQGNSQSTAWVYPNVQGGLNVTFGLSFEAEYTIPSGSQVSIYANFSKRDEVNKDLWVSHSFTSAQVKKGYLIIEVNEDIKKYDNFSLVFDKALSIGLNSNLTSSPVLLKVTCDDFDKTVVIKDSASDSLSQVYQIEKSPNISVNLFSYSSSSLIPGQENWYSFTVKLDSNLSAPFWIQLQASKDFNIIPGPYFERSEFEGMKLLRGKMLRGNDVLCYALHWIISCYIETDYYSNKTLDFKVFLKNGNFSGSFNLYFINSTGNFLVKPFYSDLKIRFDQGLNNFIDIKLAKANYSADTTGAYHDLNLWTYSNLVIERDEEVWVTVPEPYELEFSNPGIVKCSIFFYNNDKSSIDEIISKANCKIDGNTVIYKFESPFTLNSKNWTVFTLHGLETPVNGFKRKNWVFEKKLTQKIFTKKFQIMHFRNKDNKTDCSFSNLNSAFLGFNLNTEFTRLVVNNGKSIDLTRGVYAGPYLIESSDGNIDAMEIKIVATEVLGSDNKKDLEISDQGNFRLSYLELTDEFYLGTDASTPLGFYLIDWKVNG